MSVQAMSWVLDHSASRGNERLVLISIANYAGAVPERDAWEAWPGIDTIAHEARIGTRRTVQRTIDRLVEQGLLDVIRNGAPDTRLRGDRRPNLYRIMIGTGCHSSVTPSGDTGCQIDAHGVTKTAYGVTPCVSPEPLSEPTDNPSSSTDVDGRAQPDYGFDKWWEAYPRRHGRRVGKEPARVKWRRLAYETKASVYRATLNYAAAVDREETIAMDPHRFIGSTKRWLDWVDDAAPAKATHPVIARRQLGCDRCDRGYLEDERGRISRCPVCFADREEKLA